MKMKSIAFAFASLFALGAFAADWAYTITSGTWGKASTGTVTDGTWTFAAAATKTGDFTINAVVTNNPPAAVTSLDFSKTIKDGDGNVYKLVTLNPQFCNGYSSDQTISYHAKAIGLKIGALTIPEGVTSVGDYAFGECVNIVMDAKDLPSSATSYGNKAFLSVTGLTGTPNLPNVKTLVRQAFYGSGISGDIVLPKLVTMEYALSATKLTSFTFGPDLATVSSGYDQGAFENCSLLTNIVFDANSSVYFKNGWAFCKCPLLTSLDLSCVTNLYVDQDRTSSPYSYFVDSPALKKVYFSSKLKSLSVSAFYNSTVGEIHFYGAPPTFVRSSSTSTIDKLALGKSGAQSVITYLHLDEDDPEYATQLAAWQALATDGVLNDANSTWSSASIFSSCSPRSLLLFKLQKVSIEKGADADEATKTAGNFVITRDSNSATNNALIVNYTIGGTAVNGRTYEKLSGVATIPAGSYSVTVPVTPMYDGYMTEDSEVTATLVADGIEVIGSGTATVKIVDGGLLGASVATTRNADYSKPLSGYFTISRAAGDSTIYALTVSYSTSGTAVAGREYAALSGSATIPAGANSVTIAVDPLYYVSASDSSLVITLSPGPYEIGTASATMSIGKVLEECVSIAAGDDASGSNRGTFVLTRTTTGSADRKVVVNYTVSGTAVDTGSIYTLSGQAIIPAGATTATIDVFANGANTASGTTALTLTLTSGGYTIGSGSASISVEQNAASGYWLVSYNTSTKKYSMSWGGWTFPLNVSGTSVSVSTPSGWPTVISPLDFSLPVMDSTGKLYTITYLGLYNYNAPPTAAYDVMGELTLPGEGLTSIGGNCFYKCTNATGTVAFPSTCTSIAGGAFQNTTKLSILGRSLASVASLGQSTFSGATVEGEALFLALKQDKFGGFSAKCGSVRFGPELELLTRDQWYQSGFFQNCTTLTNVTFDPLSRVSLLNGQTFSSCKKLTNLDLSVVTAISCGVVGGRNSGSTFSSCSELTNVTFGTDLSSICSNAFDGTVAKLSAVRFEGLPPAEFETPYLYGVKKTQQVTTYVHKANLSTKNSAGKSWTDYAADNKIKHKGTTFASDFVATDVTDLTKRELLTIEPDSGLLIFFR